MANCLDVKFQSGAKTLLMAVLNSFNPFSPVPITNLFFTPKGFQLQCMTVDNKAVVVVDIPLSKNVYDKFSCSLPLITVGTDSRKLLQYLNLIDDTDKVAIRVDEAPKGEVALYELYFESAGKIEFQK